MAETSRTLDVGDRHSGGADLRENISLQIRSNLIGIFFLKFSKDDKRVLTDHQVDVVIGRIKVEENILVNVGLSVGLGFALLIMGMDIDLQEVLQVIK